MINKTYLDTVNKVSNKIFSLKNKKKNIFCLISGPQGSGKTTFSSHVKSTLQKNKIKVLVLSIDNFYLSKKDRQNLSNKVSSLFLIRGVPGTHNLKLLNRRPHMFLSIERHI